MYLFSAALSVVYLATILLALVILSHIYEADADLYFHDRLSLVALVPLANLVLVVILLVIYFKDHRMVLSKNPIYLKRLEDNLTATNPKLTVNEHYSLLTASITTLFKECGELTKLWDQNKKIIDTNITLVRNRVFLTLILNNLTNAKALTIEEKQLLQNCLLDLKEKMIIYSNSIYKQ